MRRALWRYIICKEIPPQSPSRVFRPWKGLRFRSLPAVLKAVATTSAILSNSNAIIQSDSADNTDTHPSLPPSAPNAVYPKTSFVSVSA